MTARVEDINGWPEIKGNPISKFGVFQYSGKAIGLPGLDDNKFYNVYRPEEELNNTETIESFKLVPWVDEHDMLGKNFMSAEEKGVGGVIGEQVYYDAPYLKANIKLFSESHDEEIDDGKRDLSIGFRCRYEIESGEFDGVSYDVVQRHIRGNHVASVDNGRVGKDVAVLDGQEKLTFSIDSKEFAMADDKKKTGEDGDKSLESLYEMVGDMKKSFDALSSDMAEMKKGSAKDAEEEEAAAAAKAAKDAEEEAAKAKAKGEGKGEDSAEIAALRQENADLKNEVAGIKTAMDSAPSANDVIKQVQQRDALAGRLSRVVGTFDHSEMTDAGEVAAYGVEKLGIACDSGNELIALDAYLQANPAQQRVVHAADSDESDGVSDYINGKSE